MLMQAHSDALPRVSERAGLRQSRQATERSHQDRYDAREFDKLEIGRDALAFYNHAVTTVVASAWLAVYAIAAIYPFIAWSLSLFQ